jgi:hypothetical protein
MINNEKKHFNINTIFKSNNGRMINNEKKHFNINTIFKSNNGI